jgi:hypothetical protein
MEYAGWAVTWWGSPEEEAGAQGTTLNTGSNSPDQSDADRNRDDLNCEGWFVKQVGPALYRREPLNVRSAL